jgi:hypothetical protein
MKEIPVVVYERKKMSNPKDLHSGRDGPFFLFLFSFPCRIALFLLFWDIAPDGFLFPL